MTKTHSPSPRSEQSPLRRALGWIVLTTLLGGIAYTPLRRALRARCDRSIRVLFVGNSYTFTNDMPGMLTSLGDEASPRVCFETEQLVRPGIGLAEHRRLGVAEQRIVAGHWNFVVLQDSSMSPVLDSASSVLDFVWFANVVRNHGARPLLFMTWAREMNPAMNAAIDAHFDRASAVARADVAPIGDAFARVRTLHREIGLYQRDGHHPSVAGTFLGAAVLFGVLSGRSPEGMFTSEVWLLPSTQHALEHEAWIATTSRVRDAGR